MINETFPRSTATESAVRYWQPAPGGEPDFICARLEAGPGTPHVHDEWQFAVADMPATLLVGAYKRHTVLPGEVAVARPYAVHGEAGGKTWRLLYVASAVMARVVGETSLPGVDLPLPADSGARAGLRRLLRDSEDGLVEGSEFVAQALDWLQRFVPRRPGASTMPSAGRQPRSAVERVQAYLRDRPTDAVSLSDAVTVAGVAASHLVRSFSRQVGLPPRSYTCRRDWRSRGASWPKGGRQPGWRTNAGSPTSPT